MSIENPAEGDHKELGETLDQEAARTMIEEARKMSSAEVSKFSLQVYQRILDPQMQQETFDTLMGIVKEKSGKGPYEKSKREEPSAIAKRIAGRVDDAFKRIKQRNEKQKQVRKTDRKKENED